jgi:hypothetical protein
MNDEICKIELSSESIDFRSIVIKSYLVESIVDVQSIDENVQSINDVESENVQSTDSSDVENQNLAFEIQIRSTRARRLSLRYQNFADIIVFLQDDEEISSISTFTFADS